MIPGLALYPSCGSISNPSMEIGPDMPDEIDLVTPAELADLINESADDVIRRVLGVDWNEDWLSRLLISNLRDILKRFESIPVRRDRVGQLHSESPLLWYCSVEIYKLTGAAESSYGDIAVVVRDEDLSRTGVAFYEAKAEHFSGRYPAFKMRQFQRLESGSKSLSLLLYEREEKKVADFDDDYILNSREAEFYSRASKPSRRSRVFPANLARDYSSPSLIPDMGRSFGHHFVYGLMSGRELDYSRPPEKAIKHWVKVTRRASPLVLSVSLSKNPRAVNSLPFLKNDLFDVWIVGSAVGLKAVGEGDAQVTRKAGQGPPYDRNEAKIL